MDGSGPFASTASYYVRYRPPYPAAFLSELRALARSTGSGALLDLACGPGRVAIPMARHFRSVLAVDVEPEMIETGEQEAARCGATNIAWQVERAEDLQLPAQSVELITIGDAIHRLDLTCIVERALEWLEPHGAFATLGSEPVWRGQEAWKHVLTNVVNKWTGDALGDPNAVSWGGPADALRAAGFKVEEHEHVMPQLWTCDSIVGFMFSTSIASRRVLGDTANDFEAHLRAALLAAQPSDRFPATQRFGCTVAIR